MSGVPLALESYKAIHQITSATFDSIEIELRCAVRCGSLKWLIRTADGHREDIIDVSKTLEIVLAVNRWRLAGRIEFT